MSDKRFQKTCQWMRTAFCGALLLLPARLECAELKYIDYEIFAGNANLPSPWVRQIFQDKRGFVWIATNNNLVRYDSQRFTTFAPNPDKAGSITTSKPLSIQSDSQDNIWISSPEALSRFDEGTETFENFTLRDTTGKSLLQNSQALILASNDHLVIGSLHGLLIFDPTRKTWTGQYTNIGGESTRVRSIVETHPGEFLLGTSTGIWRFNLETEQFSRQVYLNNQGQDVGKFGIMHILVDREERLWICADSDRLYCFSQDGAELDLTIEGIPSNQSSFTNFSSVFQDRDGNIWAAPGQSGLIALAPGSLDFQQMESNPSNKQSDKPLVSAIYELSDGTLCFGTRNSGVTMLNPKRLPIDYYSAETTPTQLAIQNVRRLTSDMNNSIWLSGSTGQLQRFDLETRAFFKTSPTTGGFEITQWPILPVHHQRRSRKPIHSFRSKGAFL